MREFEVNFIPSGDRVRVREEETILQAAQKIDTLSGEDTLTAPCGGKGTCGCCKVRLISGEAGPMTEPEKVFLKPEQLRQNYRLACQAVVKSSLKVEIPPESRQGRQVLQVESLEGDVVVEAPVSRQSLYLTETDINNPRPLWQQVSEAVRETVKPARPVIDYTLACTTEPIARKGQIDITLRGKEIINIYTSLPAAPPVGLAVDLGTTKIAGYLVNLETGKVMARGGILNPQVAYGDDVMTRLSYALEGEPENKKIRDVVVEALNRLAADLAAAAGVGTGDIEEAVIVGNTAMHHLLLNLPVTQLARAPYVPAMTSPLEVKARLLGFHFSAGCYVYFQPVIAGFVGGDHVAMILSSRIDTSSKVTLGMDIGTNTEIVLSHGGRMLSCSCASGPAFEGAHISQGMRAATGAVCAVEISDDGREVSWQCIGGVPPVGICGSGILDAIAGLYRAGILVRSGKLDTGHPRVRKPAGGGPPEFILVDSKETRGRDLVITQKDISEIQLAKAAIASGILILLENAGLKVEDLEEIVVAGAFGTFLNIESAMTIGMMPKLPVNIYRQVGNAAGAGARMALVSLTERRRGEEIAGRVGYVELMNQAIFNDIFITSLMLPPMD